MDSDLVQRSFEQFASRAVQWALVLLFLGWALVLHQWYFLILIPAFIFRAVRGFDFRSQRKWWIVLGVFTATSLGLSVAAVVTRDWDILDRWGLLTLLACAIAQTLLLISGRVRGVWTFARKA
jgi:hypothetical protein